MVSPDNTSASEEARIRVAYASRGKEQFRYSMFAPAQMLTIQERERKLLKLLARYGQASLENKRILEVGCGAGLWLREFVRWGARPENIFGIDLLPERIAEARRLCPSAITLQCQSATDLHNLPGLFDVVLQSTVFTSILDSRMKGQVASEMLRILSPAGLIVWYDFKVSNPANPDVRGVGKKEIKELFSGCRIHLETLTLAPPFGRPIARISQSLYIALSGVRVFCTHYLGIIRRA